MKNGIKAAVLSTILTMTVAVQTHGADLNQILEQHPGVQARRAVSATPQGQATLAPPQGASGQITEAQARNIFYEGPGQMSAPPPQQTIAGPPPNMTQLPLAPPVSYAPPQQQQYAPPPPAGVDYLGLKYKIILQGPDGNVREVPETFPFRTGMRFRLVFEPNISGYLYIFHKGSNSKGSRLFPDPRINNGQNQVEQYQEVMIPYSGWFLFDSNTGMEELMIFLTPQKLDTFDNLTYGADGAMPEGGWQTVTAATSDAQPPRPDAAREIATDRNLVDQGATHTPAATPKPRNIYYEGPQGLLVPPQPGPTYQAPPQQPLVYTPPVVEPNNWNLNVPAPSYAMENAPMLIHHIRMTHQP